MYEIDYENFQIEIENRIKNLCWTVSKDYSLNIKPDVEAFGRNKKIALYDAIKQGASALYFDRDILSEYIIKKVYCGAEEQTMMKIAQLCLEEASFPKISKERPGVVKLRKQAFEEMLENQYRKMSESLMGRVKISIIKDFLYKDNISEKRIEEIKKQIYQLRDREDTMGVIRCIDLIYNSYIDRSFERKHGDLDHILELEMEEISRDSWKDFLDDEMYEAAMEKYIDQMSKRMSSLDEIKEEQSQEEKNSHKKTVIVMDEEALSKMDQYMQLNYGKSYLSNSQQKRLNQKLCNGAHADCSLYYTDGILESPVKINAQYVNAKRKADSNRRLYRNKKSIVTRNIEIMTSNLRRSLIKRTQTDVITSNYGTIVPARLWRIGRTDTDLLFQKKIKQNQSDFVVEILMDASGSQRDRQSEVALQAFIISEALSNVAIPNKVTSFCTFWDFTVIQRFREYDAPRSENMKIFDYTTSSNNRDGLAVRAATESLLGREEENKILIVLSDGKPNDVIVNRPNSRNPKPYCGEYAVADTAQEIRKARNLGIYVLGVFAGKEQDLMAEKKIFGKDFAYIKDINNFSSVVGQYLQRLLDW